MENRIIKAQQENSSEFTFSTFRQQDDLIAMSGSPEVKQIEQPFQKVDVSLLSAAILNRTSQDMAAQNQGSVVTKNYYYSKDSIFSSGEKATSILKHTDINSSPKKKKVLIKDEKERLSQNLSIETKQIENISKEPAKSGFSHKFRNFLQKEKIPPIKSSDKLEDFQSQFDIEQLRLLNSNLNLWESDEERTSRLRARQRKSLKRHTVRRRASMFISPASDRYVFSFWTNMKNDLIQDIKKNFFVIAPDGRVRIFWDLIGMVFILYELIMIPMKISFNFDDSDFISVFELCIDIFFISDILLNFNTGYYHRGNLVVNRRKIAMNYIRTWFFIDLMASFPYARIIEAVDGIDENATSNNNSWISQSTRIIRIIRFFRFIRVIRLIRVFKLKTIFGKIESFISVSPTISAINGFLRLSAIILFIAHWIACFWHLIGDMEYSNEPNTWIISQQLQDQAWTSKYLASIYWAVTTMITVGYGDITPITDVERIYTLVTMLIASVVFAYSLNSISALLTNMDLENQEFKNTIVWVERYMRKMKLDVETRLKVKRYLEYTLSELTYRKDDETKLLSLLSNTLKDEVIKKINKTVLTSCESIEKFFKKTFSEVFLTEMIYFFQENIYSPGETIYHEEKDQEVSIYMIMTGSVEMSLFSCNEIPLFILRKGDHFGQIEFFTGMTRQWSARAADDFVSLFYLKRRDFLDLVENFPIDKQRFFQIKDMISLYEDYSVIDFKCYLCSKSCHSLLKCPMMHYVVNKEKFLEEQIKETYKFRRSFVRRSRSRWPSQDYKKFEQNVLKIRHDYMEAIEAFENELNELDMEKGYHNHEPHSGFKSVSDINENDEINGKERNFNKKSKSFKNSSNKANIVKSKALEIGFDQVFSFKEYFPRSNVEIIIERINSKLKLAKKMKRIRAIRKVVAFTNVKKTLLTNKSNKSEVLLKGEESFQSHDHLRLKSAISNYEESQKSVNQNDSSFFQGITDDNENDVSGKFKISDEKVAFNKPNNQENDEFSKKMNIKLLNSLQFSNNVFQNLFVEQDHLEVPDIKISGINGTTSSINLNQESKEIETKNVSSHVDYDLLTEDEINKFLNHITGKFGSQYIQGFLDNKEVK